MSLQKWAAMKEMLSLQKCTAEKENAVSTEVDRLEGEGCLSRSGQIGRRMMSQQKCTAWKENDVSVEVYSLEGE